MDSYADLLSRAAANPDVLGLILTGSHARGMAGPASDHDVLDAWGPDLDLLRRE